MDRKFIFTRQENNYIKYLLRFDCSYFTGRRSRGFKSLADAQNRIESRTDFSIAYDSYLLEEGHTISPQRKS